MKSIAIVLLFSMITNSVDYSEIWPDNFKDAILYIESNNQLIVDVFDGNNELASIALSVGFPELLRYNTIKDFFETKSLEIAYVKYGLEAVDFSIGEFQMKPSFAEALENELENFTDLKYFIEDFKYANADGKSIRNERIKRLRDARWQLFYLKVFTLYMFEKYPNLKNESAEYKVTFLASAYNYGFQASFLDIYNWKNVNAFPHGLKANVAQYSYSNIAKFYYQNYTQNSKEYSSNINNK